MRSLRDDRTVSATARVALVLPPQTALLLTAIAEANGQVRAQFVRAAIEALVHDDEAPTPEGPVPERATVNLSVAVTPATLTAVDAYAARLGVTRSAVVREAIEQAVADCGGPGPVFPPTAVGQRWPQGRAGTSSPVRTFLRRPYWFTRKFPTDEDETEA